jgi:hypothetical protein
MREYFASKHGVQSEEDFKEIANQYLPPESEGYIAAVELDYLDSEPLMIVLYYGEEGEVFMTFHDESRLDCALLPTEFDDLLRSPLLPSKNVSFEAIKIPEQAKSKAKHRQALDHADEVSQTEPRHTPTVEHVQESMREEIHEVALEEANKKIESDLCCEQRPVICDQLSRVTAHQQLVPPNQISIPRFESLPQLETNEIIKSSITKPTPFEMVDEPARKQSPREELPKILVIAPESREASRDSARDKESAMGSRLYSHRKRVMNVLGPIDANKAKSCNKPPKQQSRGSRSPAMSKIQAGYASVGGSKLAQNKKFKDCENFQSPTSTDYYLSTNSQVLGPAVSKFDKATRETVLKNKSPGLNTRLDMEARACGQGGGIEEQKVMTERMTTFLFILSSPRLQYHFAKPLEEYSKAKHFTGFKVGETRHATPMILKLAKQVTPAASMKLSKINVFFEAEVLLPESLQGDCFCDTKSDFSEAQAKVAADLELQQVSLAVHTLLSDFRESPAKKALLCVAEKLDEIVKMPASVTESLFHKVIKSKLTFKEKLVVKRIEGLLLSVQQPAKESRPQFVLCKLEDKVKDYLPADQANRASLDKLKANHKSVLRQQVLNGSSSTGCESQLVGQSAACHLA